MYSQILFTTSDRDNALSPVPRNFTRASESGRGARKPEVPPFCRFFFFFGSSESILEKEWRERKSHYKYFITQSKANK